MSAPRYERTTLVKARTSLAFAKNRVVKHKHLAALAELEVKEIACRISELEGEDNH